MSWVLLKVVLTNPSKNLHLFFPVILCICDVFIFLPPEMFNKSWQLSQELSPELLLNYRLKTLLFMFKLKKCWENSHHVTVQVVFHHLTAVLFSWELVHVYFIIIDMCDYEYNTRLFVSSLPHRDHVSPDGSPWRSQDLHFLTDLKRKNMNFLYFSFSVIFKLWLNLSYFIVYISV